MEDELVRRINAIQILVEAVVDELIETNIIKEENILKRLDSLDNEVHEINHMIYFGPKGEA